MVQLGRDHRPALVLDADQVLGRDHHVVVEGLRRGVATNGRNEAPLKTFSSRWHADDGDALVLRCIWVGANRQPHVVGLVGT